jgi:hypothetical protein
MDIRAWAIRVPDEFYQWGNVNATPWDLRRYKDIDTHVKGMSTPSNMHLLNLAVQHLGPNECYLEVGTWRGRTLIGALLDNDAFGYAIDNEMMTEHNEDGRASRDVWAENVARFGMTERTTYIDGSVPAVWEGLHTPPVGVYLFDGDKATEDAAYAGLDGVLPFLADEAIIFVDDANDRNIRMAVHKFELAYPTQLLKFMDIPTPGNCWPMFWNGVLALAWKRQP